MPAIYHAFKSGTLSDNPLTNVATTANSAGFSALPTIANPDTCWLVLDPEGTAGTPEIVQVTAHTAAATSLTIVRGQQTATGGSAARQHNVGTKWVLALTPSDLAFLLNQVLTTKGDIAVYSTAPTRLPVGANGTVLTANSAQATGLEWTLGSSRLMGSDTIAADEDTTSTSYVDTALLITWTAVAGRTYEIQFDGYGSSATIGTGDSDFAALHVGSVVREQMIPAASLPIPPIRHLFSGTGATTAKIQIKTGSGTTGIEGTEALKRPVFTVVDVT